MTPKQCRAARAVLGWTTRETAEKSQIGTNTTIYHFETGKKKGQAKTVGRLKMAFETEGIIFGKDGCSISWCKIAEI